MRNWINDTQNFLQGQYARACEVLDSNTNPPLMAIVPPLEENEARCFIMGFEEGLFTVDEEGYVQSPLLPPPSGKNTKQRILQLFWRHPKSRNLFREGVCQLATAASLVLEGGYPADSISIEPKLKNLDGGVDILIGIPEKNIIICGEVKKDQKEFQKLIDDFRYCCQRGPHTKEICAFYKNHAKYEFCSTKKPTYFFVTAPGKKLCFKLTYDGDRVGIGQEMNELPHEVCVSTTPS